MAEVDIKTVLYGIEIDNIEWFVCARCGDPIHNSSIDWEHYAETGETYGNINCRVPDVEIVTPTQFDEGEG